MLPDTAALRPRKDTEMTTFRFTCPDCCHRNEFPGAAPGHTLTCPSCRTKFAVDARRQLRRVPVATAATPPDTPEMEVLGWLDRVEDLCWCMIGGIRHFLSRTLWEWLVR